MYVTPVGEPALGVRKEQKSAKPTADDELVLRTTTEKVALRKEPRIADYNLIKRMPEAAELLVLKDSDEDKIGTYGQWIKIRDIEGDEVT